MNRERRDTLVDVYAIEGRVYRTDILRTRVHAKNLVDAYGVPHWRYSRTFAEAKRKVLEQLASQMDRLAVMRAEVQDMRERDVADLRPAVVRRRKGGG